VSGITRHTISRELCGDIECLASEAGAVVTFEAQPHGRHPRVVLAREERSRFIIVSGSSSSRSMHDAVLGDVRRTLRELGYVRPKEPPTEKKPWRNRPPQPTTQRCSGVPGPRYRCKPQWRHEHNALTAPLARLFGRMT
jgi:hypothetical protein